jgi:hypothetical protein
MSWQRCVHDVHRVGFLKVSKSLAKGDSFWELRGTECTEYRQQRYLQYSLATLSKGDEDDILSQGKSLDSAHIHGLS